MHDEITDRLRAEEKLAVARLRKEHTDKKARFETLPLGKLLSQDSLDRLDMLSVARGLPAEKLLDDLVNRLWHECQRKILDNELVNFSPQELKMLARIVREGSDDG